MNALNPGRTLRVLIPCLLIILAASCGRQDDPATGSAEVAVAAKVPITTSSDEAREAFLTGRALFDSLHRTESLSYFKRAVELDPDFAMGFVLLAAASPTAVQFFEAVANAEATGPGVSAGEQLIVDALVAGSRNDQTGQIDALNGLLSSYPDDERVHNRLATFYNTQQNFAQAIRHYQKAVSINPSFAGAFNSMGYAHRSNDDLESAKVAFARYIELLPDEANPYDSYAELLMEMGQYDESIANYRKSLAIDRNFAASYAGISINESLRGDSVSALEAAAQMRSVARTAEEKQAAIFATVACHLFAGNIDGAIAAAEEMYAVAAADGNEAAMGDVREYMGDIMLADGDGVRALAYYVDALGRRQKADINAARKAQAKRTHLFKTAIAAMISGDNETATDLVAKYKRAAEENGTSFERRRVHEHAAYLAMLNENNATVVAELALADKLDPIVLYWSAVANRDAGNNGKARDLAYRAAHRNTLSANLPFFRADALRLLDELSGT